MYYSRFDVFGECISRTDEEILIGLDEEAARNDESYYNSLEDEAK